MVKDIQTSLEKIRGEFKGMDLTGVSKDTREKILKGLNNSINLCTEMERKASQQQTTK